MHVDTTIETRELGHADLNQLAAAYRDLHPGDMPSLQTTDLEHLWLDICGNPSLVYLGAFSGAKLIATCNASVTPNLTRGGRPFAVIENVWTHSEFRQRGIGSALLQDLLSICWARNCYKVMLLSANSRTAAHEFYVRNGFDPSTKTAFVIRRA